MSASAANLLRVIEKALGGICALFLALLLAGVMTAVTMRYLGSTGFSGMEEVAVWLLLALVAAGLPLASSGALAMRLDLFGAHLSARHRVAQEGVAETIVLLACLVLCLGGERAAALLGGISPSLGLPEWVRPALLATGGALGLAVIVLRHLADRRVGALSTTVLAAVAVYALASSIAFASILPASLVLGLAACIGLIAGAPLPHAFIAAAFIAISFGSPLPQQALVMSAVSGMSPYLLLSIPFFLLAGGLLTVSGIAGDLVRFAAAMVGHRRAGLGQTVLLTGVLFSGTSGSSVANAAFGASAFMPQLTRRGYAPEDAGAIIAAVSVLDNIIPPSIAFLILAAATDLSVGKLLAGGFVAGAVMTAALAIAIHIIAKDDVKTDRIGAPERWRTARSALPAFGLGVIVVAGIRFGIVSPTEASALAATYTLTAALMARRPVQTLFCAFRQAAIETAAILLLIGSAAPLAFLLATDGVAAGAQDFAHALGGNPFAVMLTINIALLVIGLFLDIGAAILLFAPVFLPAAVAVGIDPIQFGVILVVNLMIGGLTPPVGILVQVVAGASGVPAARLFRATRPYLLALLSALALMAATAAFLAKP